MNNTHDFVDRNNDRGHQMCTGARGTPERKKTIETDVAVFRGGLTGICAAVSATRNGAEVVPVQDPSVPGVNNSSDRRVVVHGETKLTDGLADRKTSVFEKLLLDNRFNNPQ